MCSKVQREQKPVHCNLYKQPDISLFALYVGYLHLKMTSCSLRALTW